MDNKLTILTGKFSDEEKFLILKKYPEKEEDLNFYQETNYFQIHKLYFREFFQGYVVLFLGYHSLNSNDVSIEDIASFCGLNRNYFGKIFRDTIGKTPQEFLLSYRMAKAAQLLKETKLSIGTISTMVGYQNPLHFSRAFKNIYNCSPRYYRQI